MLVYHIDSKIMWRFLIFLLIVVQSCTFVEQKPVKIVGDAQGTYYSIIYYDEQNRDLQKEIDSILDKFDMSVSLWEPESLLSQINNGNDSVVVDRYFKDNFILSKKIAAATNGAFDFTIGALVKTWGFSYGNGRVIDSITIDSLLQFVGYEKVCLKNNKVVKQNPFIKFDFNAVAQGYSSDLIGDFIQSNGINNYLVDIGGEVTTHGIKPNGKLWRVGVEKPSENAGYQQDVTAIIEITDKSLATSGSYRKFFIKNGIKYSHMIDPSTGYPSMHNLLSVTVIAENAAVADAYATACMVMGLDKASAFIESKENLEALFIYSGVEGDFKEYMTTGFKKLVVE